MARRRVLLRKSASRTRSTGDAAYTSPVSVCPRKPGRCSKMALTPKGSRRSGKLRLIQDADIRDFVCDQAAHAVSGWCAGRPRHHAGERYRSARVLPQSSRWFAGRGGRDTARLGMCERSGVLITIVEAGGPPPKWWKQVATRRGTFRGSCSPTRFRAASADISD